MAADKVRLHRRTFDHIFLLIAVLAAAAYVLAQRLGPALLSRSVLGLAAFVLTGFGLPRWIGYGIRKERAEERKTEERDKWGFHGRDREGPWINYVDHPVVRRAGCAEGKRFYSEWLIIHDGKVIVNPGRSTVNEDSATGTLRVTYDFSVHRTYAWDGCTPKRFFYWIAVIGTPDWWHALRTIYTLEMKEGSPTVVPRTVIWQIAHHASLIHDALYQYLNHIPIPKKDVDRLFYAMLVESGMPRPMAKVYHLFVDLFGPDMVRPAASPAKRTCELYVPQETGELFRDRS